MKRISDLRWKFPLPAYGEPYAVMAPWGTYWQVRTRQGPKTVRTGWAIRWHRKRRTRREVIRRLGWSRTK